MSDTVSPRIIKRLETTFSSGNLKYRGISSNLSASGLFVRTQHGLVPGSIVDVEIYLPDGRICRLRGTVRRTVKTGMSSLFKDGMGIELIEMDSTYKEFLKSIGSPDEEIQGAGPKSQQTEKSDDAGKERPQKRSDFMLLPCLSCGVHNRVPPDKPARALRCGKCGSLLDAGGK